MRQIFLDVLFGAFILQAEKRAFPSMVSTSISAAGTTIPSLKMHLSIARAPFTARNTTSLWLL